jgi:hypothetical protein
MCSVTSDSIDITPRRHLPLAGYDSRRGVSQAVNDPLELNAILFRTHHVDIAILTADLLFVTAELKRQILESLQGELRLDADTLLFAASHTHHAPSVDPGKPRLGAADQEYIAFVGQQAATLLRRLAAPLGRRCRMQYICGPADHAINRRRRTWWGRMVRGPNPDGPRDETVHVIRLIGDAGELVAMLWSYGCHPVGFPHPARVSADYPGVVRRELRRAFGPELPILFLQGFSGDVRPRPAGRPHSIRRRCAEAIAGPLFNPLKEAEYLAWAESLADRVVQLAHSAPALERPLVPQCLAARIPVSTLLDGCRDRRDLSFQRVSLGPELHIAAVSAEPVAGHIRELRAIAPGFLVPVGYIDSVFGYLPTVAMLGDRGYEDWHFMRSFGLEGTFRRNIDQVVEESWRTLFADSAAGRVVSPTIGGDR